MAHYTEDLYDLCEKISEELSEANNKLDKSGGNMSAGDIEYIDKLTHALKSIKTVLAMEDYSQEGNYNRGGTYSYARGRKRDSMGRYSRDEAVEEVADVIRDSMQSMPEELKREAQRFLRKIDREM